MQHADVHWMGARFAAVPHGLLETVTDPVAIAVYAQLARFADWSTKLAHPSRSTLASLLGYKSTKPIDAALKLLSESGWVQSFPRWYSFDEVTGERVIHYEQGKGRHQTSNGYRLFDAPQGGERGGVSQETPPPSPGTPPGVPQGHTNNNQLNKNHKNNTYARPSGGRGGSEAELVAEFDEWYAAYPRKTGKGAARKAFIKARKAGVGLDVLKAGLERSVRSWAAEGRPKDKMPYPATWLNAESWDDEEITAQDTTRGRSTAPMRTSQPTYRDLLFGSPTGEIDAIEGEIVPQTQLPPGGAPW